MEEDLEKRISQLENRIKKLEQGFLCGIGFDSHKFCPSKRDIILGNVKIPFEQGFLAHSDGDVLIHAIIDSLLGAAGMKDIGFLFPDTDNKFKNIDSSVLLCEVVSILKKNSFIIRNIDTVIITQQPKISPYTDKIKKRLSELIGLAAEKIGIKAKTAEGLGFIGNGEGIAVFAVATIQVTNQITSYK